MLLNGYTYEYSDIKDAIKQARKLFDNKDTVRTVAMSLLGVIDDDISNVEDDYHYYRIIAEDERLDEYMDSLVSDPYTLGSCYSHLLESTIPKTVPLMRENDLYEEIGDLILETYTREQFQWEINNETTLDSYFGSYDGTKHGTLTYDKKYIVYKTG